MFSTKMVPLFILPKHNLAKFGAISWNVNCHSMLYNKNTLQTTNFVNKYGELVVSELEAGSPEEDTCLENIKKNKDFKFVKVF